MTTRIAPALNPDLALLLLRLATGLVFVMHGAQKFFTYTLPGTTQAFTQMGVPVPGISAPVVATVELLGGLLLILGVYSRAAGVLLAVNMLVAIALVHLKAGFFNPGGLEFPLVLLAASLAVAFAGPGRLRAPIGHP
ncbi:DoxX family protein [Deinococcus sp. JMULE3]|uniref:DoxX family protein n=1 Tax=Deinococcus sp. JMULE3 TaxID=2518341 RepID=UPI0015760075|nr:DoxX family protein [Deinococcus sp. JMULE3]NTX99709.1 DoxX family protein [Deinococcus sp. JMULE3]